MDDGVRGVGAAAEPHALLRPLLPRLVAGLRRKEKPGVGWTGTLAPSTAKISKADRGRACGLPDPCLPCSAS